LAMNPTDVYGFIRPESRLHRKRGDKNMGRSDNQDLFLFLPVTINSSPPIPL